MNQEEILKAIKEQTRAIERLIEAVERQSLCLEWYALQLRQVLGTDLEKVAPTTADMTDEEHKEQIKKLFAEIEAAERAKRK